MSGLLPRLGLISMVLLLGGCSLFGGDKPPPPKEIEIKPPPKDAKIDFVVTASPLVNPGPDGVPSPVVMRLYFLAAPQPFTDANFFELWEHDEATLGPTLLGKQELYLNPSDVQHITAPLDPKALMVGVTVGFRDFQKSKWRALVPLQGEKTLKLLADVKSDAVNLGPQK